MSSKEARYRVIDVTKQTQVWFRRRKAARRHARALPVAVVRTTDTFPGILCAVYKHGVCVGFETGFWKDRRASVEAGTSEGEYLTWESREVWKRPKRLAPASTSADHRHEEPST